MFERLILHVGTHKTGTSAIQRWCNDNRDNLARRGYLYPLTGQWSDSSHHVWAFELGERLKAVENGGYAPGSESDPIGLLLQQLAEEKARVGVSQIIISSELFEKFPYKPLYFKALKDRLLAIAQNVVIVIFLRRQDLLLESVFKQWVKDKAVRLHQNISSFVDAQSVHLDYFDLISKWATADEVSDVQIHSNALSQDPVKVFAKGLGLDSILGRGFKSYPTVNPSLDGLPLEFKHITNALNITPDNDDRILSALRRLSPSDERLSLFDEDERYAVINRFEHANSKLAQTFDVEPFFLDSPYTDRQFSILDGKKIKKVLDEIEVFDERLVWMIISKWREQAAPRR